VTEASVRITNTGTRAGDEVVQLYVTDDVASVARPSRSLVGFTRVELAPDEAKTITFSVHPSRLAFYDASMQFVCEPGAFLFAVGASRSDLRARATVELDGDVEHYLQRENRGDARRGELSQEAFSRCFAARCNRSGAASSEATSTSAARAWGEPISAR